MRRLTARWATFAIPREPDLSASRRTVLAVIAVGLLFALPVAAHAGAFPQTRVLDAYEPNNDHFAGPIRSASALTAGLPYVAEVQGTFSYYAKQNLKRATLEAPWSALCGTPLDSPMFPSSQVKKRYQKRVNLDPEFLFAHPARDASNCSDAYPRHWTNFQFSTVGRAYAHVEPLGPYPSVPAVDHKYAYPLLGAGQVARFRLVDRPRTDDNYGELHITIRQASPAECAADFARFGLPSADGCAGSST
jgi:hypothetical protein